MLALSCFLLGVAVFFLSAVSINLTRRLRAIEKVCQMAAESLGAPEHG